MSLWVLDTDHVSLLLERHPQVSRQVAEVGAEVAISIVTVQELFNGWVVRINSAQEVEDVVRLYGKLSRTVRLGTVQFHEIPPILREDSTIISDGYARRRHRTDFHKFEPKQFQAVNMKLSNNLLKV